MKRFITFLILVAAAAAIGQLAGQPEVQTVGVYRETAPMYYSDLAKAPNKTLQLVSEDLNRQILAAREKGEVITVTWIPLDNGDPGGRFRVCAWWTQRKEYKL